MDLGNSTVSIYSGSIFLFGGRAMNTKWKDSDDHSRLGDKSARDFLEEESADWNHPDTGGYFTQIPAQLKPYMPFLIAVVMIVAFFGGLKMLFYSAGKVDDARLTALEEKIQRLDEKYGKFDSIDSKVTRIWEQAKSFESFRDRFDRTEASMTLRMDHLATNIDSVQKRLADADTHAKATRPVQQKEKKRAEKNTDRNTSVRYHTVAAKETLYGISLKYGIKLDNLLRMNNMAKDTVIQPGQKLIVKR